MQTPKNNITDIIWIQTAFLGDIILTTAAFNLVKKKYPNCSQHLITTPIGAAALKDHPALDSIIPFNKRQSGLLASIKSIKQKLKDQGIQPKQAITLQAHKSYRSSLLAFGLGLPVTTYQETQLSFLAKHKVDRVAIFHEAERIALLTSSLKINRSEISGIKPSLVALELKTDTPWQKTIHDWDGKVIGVFPGSVWGTKRWPAESYAQYVKESLLNKNNLVLLMGSQEEAKICQGISDQFSTADSSQLINIAGKTSLDDLRRVIPACDLIVANDSSAIHYASAFDIPTLAIFGSTIPQMGFGPLAKKSQVIENHDIACRPCGSHGPALCPKNHFQCMKGIDPKEVCLVGSKLLQD